MADMKIPGGVQTQPGTSTATTSAATGKALDVSTSSTQSPPKSIPSFAQGPVAALFADVKKASMAKQPGTLKPHEARMTAVSKPKHESFAAAFAAVMGPEAVADLKATIGKKPIVLVAGDQCTGKGTAAEGLVAALGGQNTGTGTVLRALAKENGLSIEQMSGLLSGKTADIKGDDGASRTVSLRDFPHLGSAEDVDVRLDYRAATAIAGSKLEKADGETIDISVFESRLAGHLGQFLEGLGRENIVSVYLYAAPRVQAERYLKREVFDPAEQAATSPAEKAAVDGARATAAAVLAGLNDSVGLEQCLQTLVDAKVPGLAPLAQKVAGIAGRDVNDKSRLLSLYGVDYQDRSAFDVVVDTNGKSPAEVKAAILAAVETKTSAS